MNKTYQIGPQLFSYIEKHFGDYLEDFSHEDAELFYNSDVSNLTVQSKDPDLLVWFERNVVSKVSEQTFPLSHQDLSMLSSEKTSQLFQAFTSTGEVDYVLGSQSLLLFGLRYRVDSGTEIFLKEFYFQFPLERPVKMYWSVFNSLRALDLPDKLVVLVDNMLVIEPSLQFDDCRHIRIILHQITSSVKCVPFPNFTRELIPAYIDYLKTTANSTVVLCFEDGDGKISKKHKMGFIPFLAGLDCQIDTSLAAVAHPITCHVNHSENGFQVLQYQLPYKTLLKMKKTHSVAISVYKHFTEIQGMMKENVEHVVNEILKYLGRHAISTEYTTSAQAGDDEEVIINMPVHWTGVNREECTLVPLEHSSAEFRSIAKHFHRTNEMPFRIDRIQNRHQLYRYIQSKERLFALEIEPNEVTVFHGSSNTAPVDIYNCVEGFDFRLSNTGMWGRANYFTDDVRMADMFAYKCDGSNLKQIFVARLLSGNSIAVPEDSTLTAPPFMPQKSLEKLQRRYDTIVGIHISGYRVYVVYGNENTLPEYLITYF